MDRVLQLTGFTASVTFYDDGAVVDPGVVTVGITRADGSVLVAAGTATGGSGAAPRTFALTTTHTALLDSLTARWTSPTKGTLTTYVQVVGGFLFSLNDLDVLLQTPGNFSAAEKAKARIWAEQKIEQAIGTAFVPRYARETLSGTGMTYVQVHWPNVRTIRSITVDGLAISSLTPYVGDDSGFIHYDARWTVGHRNIVIGYEHGADFPEPDVADAAALWAKVRLVSGPVDDRELQRFIADTGAIVNLATPGRNSWSGIPDVDAVIESRRVTALVG